MTANTHYLGEEGNRDLHSRVVAAGSLEVAWQVIGWRLEQQRESWSPLALPYKIEMMKLTKCVQITVSSYKHIYNIDGHWLRLLEEGADNDT